MTKRLKFLADAGISLATKIEYRKSQIQNDNLPQKNDRGGVAAGSDQQRIGPREVDPAWASVDAAFVVGEATVGGLSGGVVFVAGQ